MASETPDETVDAPKDVHVSAPKPTSKRDGLLVQELGDETLVYDPDRHEAHCLNQSAALVWQASDGSTAVPDIARRMVEVGLPQDEIVVWMGLSRLERAGLLAEPVHHPGEPRRFSRREVVRMLGITAGLSVALPAVTSITAPLAAQAASCVPLTQCYQLRPPNCTGLPTCENRNRCCAQQGGGGRWGGRRGRCRPQRC